MADDVVTGRKKGFWARLGSGLTTFRIFVTNVVFLILLMFILGALFSTSGVVVVPDNSALVLNPRGVLVDQRAITDSLESLLSADSAGREVELGELVSALERAADDDRITMLVLRLDRLQGVSPGHADTLGKAVQAFRDAGKETLAYGNFFSQGQYQLASYAESVYLHPMGQVVLPGYGGNGLYFKELLDKLNVNINIFRVGKYKEFIEPYTRTDMSAEAREANQVLIDALWSHYSGRIIANRDISLNDFNDYTQNLPEELEAAGDMATAAVENLLVDELLTPDALRSRVASIVGYNDKGEFNGIGYRDYLAGTEAPTVEGDGQIAVITASGPVVTGKMRGTVAADRVIPLIREVRRDDDLAGLVLRLNTPGGSSFASELIRQELELLQLAGKPVVVSMSNVAASGGYWIASTTDRIVAEPTTITGSIGVFGVVPTFERSLEAIGVASDGVGTTPLSRADPLAGLTPAMEQLLQSNVEVTYEQFLNLVARGRDMAPEAVDEIAQGRVWIGDTAAELGLVDELGGLDDAISAAAALAGLETYGIRHVSAPMSAREMLFQQFLSNETSLLADDLLARGSWSDHPLLGRLANAWQQVSALNDPGHSYALCEGCLDYLDIF
jgi:protease-4